jgi:hypothetical protein
MGLQNKKRSGRIITPLLISVLLLAAIITAYAAGWTNQHPGEGEKRLVEADLQGPILPLEIIHTPLPTKVQPEQQPELTIQGAAEPTPEPAVRLPGPSKEPGLALLRFLEVALAGSASYYQTYQQSDWIQDAGGPQRSGSYVYQSCLALGAAVDLERT